MKLRCRLGIHARYGVNLSTFVGLPRWELWCRLCPARWTYSMLTIGGDAVRCVERVPDRA